MIVGCNRAYRVWNATRIALAVVAVAAIFAGCRSPAQHRKDADETAAKIISEKQKQAFGKTEPFTVEVPADTLRRRLLLEQNLPYASPASLGVRDLQPIKHWPKGTYPPATQPATQPAVPTTQPVRLTLVEALAVGARSSREYQDYKDGVFESALALDLERDEFRNSWAGIMSGELSADHGGDDTVTGVTGSPSVSLSRRFKNGLTITQRLSLDLVRLLSPDQGSTLGILGDFTASLPLLRGAGEHIVTEPLTQAERNVVYQLHRFEDFKRSFAVQIARQYLTVLQQLDAAANAEDNYENVVRSTRRARRLADSGRLEEGEVDQAIQQELRARERWISARESYGRVLDNFKMILGLPTDALIELDRQELGRMAEAAKQVLEAAKPDSGTDDVPPADAPVTLVPPTRDDGGQYELPEEQAVEIALKHRLDLRTSIGQVYDAQRKVVVAADALGMGLDLQFRASAGEGRGLGSAGQPSGRLRPDRGFYAAAVDLDLPLERTAQRNSYRASLLNLEQAIRSEQELEDRIKLDIRDGLRNLLLNREGLTIQSQAVRVAERRVRGASLLLEAGRVEMRDLLEAQEALVSAQNAFTAALIDYRVAELTLQQDMGVLEVNEEGLWREYNPNQPLN